MTTYILPVLYTLFVWWLSTALILWLGGRPKSTYPWSMAAVTAVLGLALYGLAATRDNTSEFGAYLSFSCGIGVWAWIETSFLLGYATGPRRVPCPANITQRDRFVGALQTILHHEFALLAAGAVVLALGWNAANTIGMWTFLVLWSMRLSAKLNLFLGVRNVGEEFLPEHLRYLETYFRRRPMNLLMPVSIAVPTLIAVMLIQTALHHGSGSFELAGYLLLATLTGLAVLEHWLMVLPFSASSLWRVAPALRDRS